VAEDVCAVEDAIGMRDEKLKQREFTSCDVDAHTVYGDSGARRRVKGATAASDASRSLTRRAISIFRPISCGDRTSLLRDGFESRGGCVEDDS
jgi:hypothetical protein